MKPINRLKTLAALAAITPMAACAHAPQLYNTEGGSYHYEESYNEGDRYPKGRFSRTHYAHDDRYPSVRQDVEVNVDQRNRQRAYSESAPGSIDGRGSRDPHDWKLYRHYRDRLSPLEGDIVYGDKNLYFGGSGFSEDDYFQLRSEEIRNEYEFLQNRNDYYFRRSEDRLNGYYRH
jgi:hypothetical protein